MDSSNWLGWEIPRGINGLKGAATLKVSVTETRVLFKPYNLTPDKEVAILYFNRTHVLEKHNFWT